MTLRLIFLAGLPVLLTACAAAPTGPANLLAGTRWRVVTIDEAAPVSKKSELALTSDNLSATAGCNRLNGPWRIEGERMIAGPLIQTMMACDDAVMAQEQALSTLLTAAPKVTVSGKRLLLKTSGHAAEFRRED